MRPLALTAVAAFVVAAVACGGAESAPAPDPGAITGPQLYFIQIDN